MQHEVITQPVIDSNSEKTDGQHQSLLLSPGRMMEIDTIVKEVLNEKKPYLQQRYSLKDLAVDTNIPLHQLSAFINKYWGKNFNDFINEFRVKAIQEAIRQGAHSEKTLLGLAYDSGFNSKATFNRVFKKMTGQSPSQYIARNNL